MNFSGLYNENHFQDEMQKQVTNLIDEMYPRFFLQNDLKVTVVTNDNKKLIYNPRHLKNIVKLTFDFFIDDGKPGF